MTRSLDAAVGALERARQALVPFAMAGNRLEGYGGQQPDTLVRYHLTAVDCREASVALGAVYSALAQIRGKDKVNIGADPRGGSLPLPQAKCEAVGMGSTPTAPTTPSPAPRAEAAVADRLAGALRVFAMAHTEGACRERFIWVEFAREHGLTLGDLQNARCAYDAYRAALPSGPGSGEGERGSA